MDFIEVKRLIRAVVERLDHHFINDLAPFDAMNPSAENMAKYFYDEINAGMAARAAHPRSEDLGDRHHSRHLPAVYSVQ